MITKAYLTFVAKSIIMVSVILLSGCKVQREVAKHSEKSDQNVTVSNEVKVDHNQVSTTKTTERINDVVETPPVNVSASSVGTAVTTVVNGDTLSARYDPVMNTINAQFTGKPKSVPVKKEVITESTVKTNTQVQSKSDSTGQTSTAATDKQVEVKRTWTWWWLLIGAGIVVAGWFGYKWYKKRYNPP